MMMIDKSSCSVDNRFEELKIISSFNIQMKIIQHAPKIEILQRWNNASSILQQPRPFQGIIRNINLSHLSHPPENFQQVSMKISSFQSHWQRRINSYIPPYLSIIILYKIGNIHIC